MDKPRLAIVIPAFNEQDRIGPTLARIDEYMRTRPYDWSVAVVSDGSTDQTVATARQFAEEHRSFSVVDSQPNRGKGYVVRQGVLAADADWVLFSDADLATPIEEVEKLIAAIDGSEIAIGSRPLKESRLEIRQPWHREMLGRLFNFMVQAMAVRGIHDTQCGFKLFTRKAARDVFARCKLNGFGFDFEALMVARDLGYSIAEVPVRWRHQEGSKVVLLRDGPRMLRDLVKLRLQGKRKRLEPSTEVGGAG